MAQPCAATGHHQEEEEAESALTPDRLSLGIDDICELSASLMSEGHPTREASEQPGMLQYTAVSTLGFLSHMPATDTRHELHDLYMSEYLQLDVT
jgi:hypothetical protein